MCGSFVRVNQQKYILSAILVLAIAAVTYWAFKKFPKEKDAENISTIIDYDKPADTLSYIAADGKRIFISNCASCHNVFKDGTGPRLAQVTERGPWKDSKKLYKYIRESASFQKNKYIDSLRNVYGVSYHIEFSDLNDNEIMAILQYINIEYTEPVVYVVD